MTSELPGMGALKRAAIDAYMRQNGFDIKEQRYECLRYQHDAYLTIFVEHPDTQGQGGGHTTGFIHPIASPSAAGPARHFDDGCAYGATFDAIRQTIDSLFEPWKNLPDGGEMATEEDKFFRFLASVSLSSITGNATMLTGPDGHYKLEAKNSYAAGEIKAELAQLTNNISGLSGHGISAFKEGFLTRFELVLSSLLGIGFSVGSAIGIERGLAEVAQAHISQVISEATLAFTNIAQQRKAYAPRFLLDLIAAAIPFAGSFVAASLAKDLTIQAATFVANQAKAMTKDPTPCATYEATIEGMRNGLTVLNEDYRNLEQQLAEYYLRLLSEFEIQASSYDLTPKAITLPPDGKADLQISDYAMDEVDRSLAVMHEELKRGLSLVNNTNISITWLRDPRIGLRGNGPSSEFNQVLRELIYRFEDLANDTDISRKNLRTWHEAMQDADAAILAELEEIVREINDLIPGSTVGPTQPATPLPPQIKLD